MKKYNGMISNSLMLHLCGNGDIDSTDQMRLNIFTMECERLTENLDSELPLALYVDNFCKEIVKTTGYHTFTGFCNIDIEGLRDLGERVYNLVNL